MNEQFFSSANLKFYVQDGRDSAVLATESRSPGAGGCGHHEGLQGKLLSAQYPVK